MLAREPGNESRVVWVQCDGEVEEAELAYAGVGPDLPGPFTLCGRVRLLGLIWRGGDEMRRKGGEEKRGPTME